MTDPQLGNPINELPSQEEIGGKPFDDQSAPAPLFPVNNSQNQFEKSNDDIQIQNENSAFTMTDNYQFKKYKDQDNSSNCRKLCFINKWLITSLITTIMLLVYDLVCHILYKFSPYILVDDVVIFISTIIIIYYICKYKSDYNVTISIVVTIVTLIGFGLRIFGLSQYNEGKPEEEVQDSFVTIHIFLLIVRLMASGCCIGVFNGDFRG